jgi:hypothetical protein
MPANLTPEYEKAELRYRQATSDDERLAALQAMLSAIPKHKGVEKMPDSWPTADSRAGKCTRLNPFGTRTWSRFTSSPRPGDSLPKAILR